LDPLIVQRGKKKLLAEFDLGAGSLQGISQHDALQWLENISSDELRYHKLIYERPVILNFLEHDEVSGDPWYATLPDDDRARAFILGLVQQQYNALFAKGFQSNDIQRLEQLKAFELPELDKKGRYYYSATANLFTSYYHQLNALLQDFSPEKVNAFRAFGEQHFFETIASLPPYFDSMRNEFANALLQAADKLADDSIKAVDVAFMLSNIARAVAASREIKETARRFSNQHVEGRTFAGNSPSRQSTSLPDAAPRKKNYGCIIAAVIVFVVIRLLTMLLR